MSTLISAGFAAWRECREAYDELLHAQYQLAEDRTNGALLNAKGREKGIDPWRLFKSNATFRNAYASEELLAHWADRPHTTFAAFEKTWQHLEETTVAEDFGLADVVTDEEIAATPGRVCKHCGEPVYLRELTSGADAPEDLDWSHVEGPFWYGYDEDGLPHHPAEVE